jgi:Ca2+-binding EF-hand superfamily protein
MARQNDLQSSEFWKQYDLNGDGKITPSEFAAVRATCFLRYDANGDRMLTREEVKRASPPQFADRLDATFSRLDLDGDGLISREEFDRESDRLFRQWDTNGDGVLAGSELSNVIPAASGGMCTDRTGRPLAAPGGSR